MDRRFALNGSGSTQDFTLASPDWFGGSGDVAVEAAYQNRPGSTTYQGKRTSSTAACRCGPARPRLRSGYRR